MGGDLSIPIAFRICGCSRREKLCEAADTYCCPLKREPTRQAPARLKGIRQIGRSIRDKIGRHLYHLLSQSNVFKSSKLKFRRPIKSELKCSKDPSSFTAPLS